MELHNALLKAREGDADAYEMLFKTFGSYIKNLSRKYNLQGGTNEDLEQEGNIAIYKAVQDYDPEKLNNENDGITAFCRLVIKRHILTAMNRQTNLKYKALNSSFSMDIEMESKTGKGTIDAYEAISNTAAAIAKTPVELQDPSKATEIKDMKEAFEKFMDEQFTDIERIVFQHHLDGEAYEDIAAIIGKTKKAVDNTLQRTKRKIEVFKIYYETGTLYSIDYYNKLRKLEKEQQLQLQLQKEEQVQKERKMTGPMMKEATYRMLEAATLPKEKCEERINTLIQMYPDSNFMSYAGNLRNANYIREYDHFKEIEITEKGAKKLNSLHRVYGTFKETEQKQEVETYETENKEKSSSCEAAEKEQKQILETDISNDELIFLLQKALKKKEVNLELQSAIEEKDRIIETLQTRVIELENQMEEQKEKFKSKLMQVFELQ
jgi:RNA polymerase sporulation-specific sigma factor